MDGTQFVETNAILRQTLEEAGICSDALLKEIARQGSLTHVAGFPGKFGTSLSVPTTSPPPGTYKCRPLSRLIRTTPFPKP